MAELAWPEDLGHGTFVGRFGFMDADSHDTDRDPDITSATGGTVTITPSIKSVRYSGVQGPMILAARPAKGVIDAEGYLCTEQEDGTPGDRGMVFPATDDTDLTPTDWTYSVSIVLTGSIRLPSFDVKLPEGSTVDLSVAVPVPPSGGTAIVVDPTTAERAEDAATRAEAAATAAEDWAPSFVWDGTKLVIDGGEPVDLKGEKGTTAWADLTGKPASFPSTVPDVEGLTDRLAALEYDSGWRDVTSLLRAEYTALNPDAYATLRRVGPSVNFNLQQGRNATAEGAMAALPVPSGFRVDPAHRTWGSTGIEANTGQQVTDGAGLYLSGDYVNTHARTGKRYSFSMTWLTSDPIPTTPPGDPA